ncbi:hypothetical protein Bca52824_033250 [Brassica carinata]|uniref:Uncharacterized protein n=1 Tax=Brassica carinata TaxID=52824 RepID=A0A8X7SIG0_BRACI|nr:hypothetical protein Bca52824_033250 [Brassica carinata]
MISHDEQTIVTEAGYEILRFWNVFPSMKAQNEALRSGAGPAQKIRQDSIGVLIGPIRHPHRRSAGLDAIFTGNDESWEAWLSVDTS